MKPQRVLILAVAATGLLLTILPAILVFMGVLGNGEHKSWMAVGALFWFGAAPLLMRKGETT